MVTVEPVVESPGPPISPSINPVAASWALFTGIALLMLGNGLQGSLIGIRSELEEFPAIVSGGIMAAYFAGFLTGSRAASRALASVGHVRVFAALASMASSAALVHAVAVHPVSWILMRFTTGICMAGLYVVAESWINDLATNATRGRLLALYMVVSMGGMASGQFLLNLADPRSFELFVISSVLISLALVPVSLSGRASPPALSSSPMKFSELMKVVPTGPTVACLVGVAHGSLRGLGALYATRGGLAPGRTALFMFAPMAGGVVLQFPIGLLSDRMPRRGVMLAVALGATIAAGLLLVAPAGGPAAILLMFLVGGFSFPLYSLGIAYTHDWIRPEQATGASVLLVTTTGVGAVIGPLLTALLIVGFGNRMFFVAIGSAHAAIAAYLAFRVAFRAGVPMSRQSRVVPFPARASATAIALLGRRRR